MPSTKEKNSVPFQRACSELPGGAGEPLGEPAPPPPRTTTAPRDLSEELVGAAVEQARLRSTVRGLPEQQRREMIEALLEELADGREVELPEELSEQLLDGLLDRLIAGKRGEREILGQDGVLGELTRRLIQRALSEELSEHLGYPAGQAPPGGAGNSRNGTSPKTVLTDHGRVPL